MFDNRSQCVIVVTNDKGEEKTFENVSSMATPNDGGVDIVHEQASEGMYWESVFVELGSEWSVKEVWPNGIPRHGFETSNN